MKRTNKLMLALILSVMGIASLSGNSVDIYETPVVATAGLTQGLEGDPINNNSEIQNYYSGIDSSLTGDELLKALQSLNARKRIKTIGYSNMWDYYDETDVDPNNNSRYLAYYRGTSASRDQMNKEHVWPKSHGSINGVEKDIHVIRPTLKADNSSRGNEFYVEGKTGSNGWDPYADGMVEKYRGDAARIIFYCVVADSKLKLVDTDYHYTTNDNPDNQMGKLSDLLEWNLKYPVDSSELRRNNAIEKSHIQGNRNPFIDDRSLACKIWGDYNENTRNVCRDALNAVTPTSISITPDNPTINVGSKLNLSINVTPSDASKNVIWASSNSSVASVNNGVLTGVKEGSATITAFSSLDNSISDSITVTVKGIKSISLSGTPSKTAYYEGDEFNPSGLKVTATFSDNTTEIISNSSVSWLDGTTRGTTLSKGTASVIAKCGNAEATFNGITVVARPQQEGCTLISKTSDLKSGDKVVLAYSDTGVVAGELSGKYLSSQSATFSSDKTKITSYKNALVFTLGGSSGAWTFDYQGSKLGAVEDKNLSFGSGTDTWDISISSGSADISSTNSNYGKLQYNKAHPRFVNYGNASQEPINIYRIIETTPTPNPGDDPTTSVGGNTSSGVTSEKVLTSLSIIGSVNKSVYFEGEKFDPSGLLIMAKYSDNDVSDVTSKVIWPSQELKVEDTKVVGTYTENNVTLSVEIEIEVKANIQQEGCAKSSSSILNLLALISVLGIIILKKKY